MKILFISILVCATFISTKAQSLRNLLEQEETVLFSHRVALEPDWVENSISSLKRAAALGFKMHEIDVMESKDGVLYVLHDRTLDRTTTGTGAIKELESTFLNGIILEGTEEPLPKLDDFLAMAKAEGLYFMLDVKTAALDKVIGMVKEYGLLEQIIVLTFSKERAEEALALGEIFLLSVLIEDEEDFDYYLCKSEQPYYLAVYINKTGPASLFEQARDLGLPTVTDVMGAIDARAQVEGTEVYAQFIQERKPNILVSDYPLQIQVVVGNE
ncbi:MAG: glycerophosphodiester phosphodiesterase family protein [Mongoliitalea sp.]